MLTSWLEEAGGEEAVLSGEVRIVLVSAGFGTEITTTTVLWLNTTYNLDITCIRLIPHRVGSRLLLDITQLVPLPEAEEFTVKLRRREQTVRASTDGRDWTQYVVSSPDGESKPLRKRWAVLEMVSSLHAASVPVSDLVSALPNSRFISAGGHLAGDELIEAFGEKYAKFRANVGAWFVEHPLHDGETTSLLSKMWGRQTVRALDRLLKLAPSSELATEQFRN